MRKRLRAWYAETAYGWWIFFGATTLLSYAFRDENAIKGLILGVFFGAPSMVAFSFRRNFGFKAGAPMIVGYLGALLLGLLLDLKLVGLKLWLFALCLSPALLGVALGELSKHQSSKETPEE